MLPNIENIRHRILYALAVSRFRSRREAFYEDLSEALLDEGEVTPLLNDYRLRAGSRKQIGESMLYGHWLQAMDKMAFAKALRGTVPMMDSMILESAELTGNLAEGLKFLAKAVNISNQMRSIIRKAMAMPVAISIATLSILVAIYVWLVPVFSQIYEPSGWPIFGRILYYGSKTVFVGGPVVIPLIIGVIYAFGRSLSRWTGPMRMKLDKLPPYSIYRDYTSAIFLVTLASLLQAGLSVVEALKKMQDTANPWLRWHIGMMLLRLDVEPDNAAKAMDTGLFPQYLADRIEDFGKRSTFRVAIEKVGLQGAGKVIGVVENASALINRLMYVALGVVFGVIVLGTITTGISADQAIKAKIRGMQQVHR